MLIVVAGLIGLMLLGLMVGKAMKNLGALDGTYEEVKSEWPGESPATTISAII